MSSAACPGWCATTGSEAGASYSLIAARTIVRGGQFRLFFFSREEPRVHVHVAHPDGEAKFWLAPAVHLAVNIGLSSAQLGRRRPSSWRTSGRSKMPCTDTLAAEVTNISPHDFWLLLGDEELAVPYAEFAWFRSATVEQIATVERPSENHLYWPKLDVDLSVEPLRNPAAFPLRSRSAA